MSSQTSTRKLLKTTVLGFAVLLINVLLLRPFQPAGLLSGDDGIAHAQTGPADDTPTPIPTAQQPTIIIVPIPDSGSGGTGGSGGNGSSGTNGSGQTSNNDDDDNEDNDDPTPTFTPLPSTTPTLSAPEVVIIEVTPSQTETVAIPPPQPPVTEEPPVAEASPTTVVPTGPELINNSPPDGISPLAGNGAIYRIPADPNRTPVELMVELTRGKLTLTVPTFPELDLVVRIDEDPALALNLPLPIPNTIRPTSLFNLDVYLVSGNTVVAKVTTHSPELILTTQQADLAPDEQVALLRYHEPGEQYEFPRQEYDTNTQTFAAYLDKTSLFILGVQSGQASLVALAPTPIPTVPPFDSEQLTTPDPEPDGAWLSLLWLFLAFLVIFAGLIGLFFLLGGGRALAALVGRTPAAGAAEQYQTGGLLLAFPKQTLEVRSPIQVDLAALPTNPPRWTGSETRAASAQVDLPTVGVLGYISTLKPNMPYLRQALVIPTGVKLIGWDETNFRLSKLSYAIAAGYMDWPDQAESFSHLHDLQAGDEIEIRSSSGSVYQYRVDDVQSYQAEHNVRIDIPQTAPGPQLLLTAWSEPYDLDNQEFRDYVVIHARVEQTEDVNPTNSTEAHTLMPSSA
ncbi:MAG: hypothetical protein KDJ52_21475 [Anaerolineae bacterium]|nr:hypothetical protein [Anaerolineae bacterium]